MARRSIYDLMKRSGSSYAPDVPDYSYGASISNTTIKPGVTDPLLAVKNEVENEVVTEPDVPVASWMKKPFDITRPKSSEGDIYSKMIKMSTGLAAFEGGMSLLSAAQSVFAKPTTVTKPRGVVFTKPKIESNVEATRSIISENLGKGVNTAIEAAKERGIAPNKILPGVISASGETMRRASAELSREQQDKINQGEIIGAEISNKEAAINAEINNRYIERKDQIRAADSAMRGQQLSASISGLGSIFGRVMNERLMVNILKDEKSYADMDMRMRAIEAGITDPILLNTLFGG